MKKLFVTLLLPFVFAAVVWLGFPEYRALASFTIATPTITGTTTILPLQTYVLTATGFAPKDKLVLGFHNSVIGTGIAGAQGGLTFTARIPGNVVFGHYTMTVRNQANVSATYPITLAPGLGASVAYGYPGSLIRLEGLGFTAMETVTLVLNNSGDCLTPVHTFGTTRASPTGSFGLNVTLPLTATAGVTYSLASSGITSTVCAVAP